MAAIYAFLNGDFTPQISLKAMVIAAAAGGNCTYYLREIQVGVRS